MEYWAFWAIAAALFLIIEVLTLTLWCLCLGVATLVAMVVALCGAAPQWQILALVVGSALSYFLLMPVFRHQRHLRSQPDTANARTGMDALLGRTAEVTHEILPGEMGRARIDGDSWQVRARGVDTVLRRGTPVKVIGFDSIVLNVAPFEQPQ